MFLTQKVLTLKKDTVLLMSCCILCLLVISCNKWSQKKESALVFTESTVLKINDIPVSIDEYMMFLEEEKAMTFNYFFQKYGIEKSNTFWQSTHDNETPIQYIREKTNTHLRQVKVVQDYAAKMNVVKPFDFEVFLKDWQAENKTRKLKHDAGGIVYGPIETNMKDYYFYVQTNLDIRLKDKLDETVFVPSENELQDYYNTIKKIHFTYIDTLSVEYLSFPYQNSTQRKQSFSMAKKAYDEVLKTNTIKALKNQYNIATYKQKQFYDGVKLYGEENPDRIIKSYASNLKFGETKLVDTKSEMNSSIYIMKLLKPINKQFRSFDNVRKEVAYFYKENRYKRLIDSLNKNAVFDFNEKVYNKILKPI
ncbi:hypothetical protein [Algibacter sp. 2305UL17-15]|uniref:hypothetical protein n=1 Tax=Algibacter sp. 2305UL17-15 TaxID=3231268 RepID=UPI0034579E02